MRRHDLGDHAGAVGDIEARWSVAKAKRASADSTMPGWVRCGACRVAVETSWRCRGSHSFAIMLNHWYHHRGQLLVYLRLLNQSVPSVYGPTADENPFAA